MIVIHADPILGFKAKRCAAGWLAICDSGIIVSGEISALSCGCWCLPDRRCVVGGEIVVFPLGLSVGVVQSSGLHVAFL